MTCSKCGIASGTDPCPECKRLLEDLAGWLGWAEANGYGNECERDFGYDDMRDAFKAGMQAQRDLDARPAGPRAGAPLRDRQGIQYGHGNTQINTF